MKAAQLGGFFMPTRIELGVDYKRLCSISTFFFEYCTLQYYTSSTMKKVFYSSWLFVLLLVLSTLVTKADWLTTTIGFNDHFKCVYFWDQNNGVIAGEHGLYYTSTASTTNTWSAYKILGNTTDSLLLNRCVFNDITTGGNNISLLCGSDTINHSAIIFKIDFNSLNYDILYQGASNSKLNAIEIVYNSTNNAMAVGDNGLIVHSSNLFNFTTINSGTTQNLHCIGNYASYTSATGYIYHVAMGGDNIVLSQTSNASNSFITNNYAGMNLRAISTHNNYFPSFVGYGVQANFLQDYGNMKEITSNYDFGNLNARALSNKTLVTDHGIFITTSSNQICEYQPSSNAASFNDVSMVGNFGYAVGHNSTIMRTYDLGGSTLPYCINEAYGGCNNTHFNLEGRYGHSITNCKWLFDNIPVFNNCGSYGSNSTYGAHTATYIVTNSFGFSDTSIKTIYIVPPPNINLPTSLTDTIPLCKNGFKTIKIQNTQTGFTYRLRKNNSIQVFGSVNGNAGTLYLNTSYLDQGGNYYIEVMDSVSECFKSFTDSIWIPIEETKAVMFHNLINAFPGESVNFYSKNVDAATSHWTFSNGAIPSVANSVDVSNVQFSTVGQSNIVLIATSMHGCKDTLTTDGPYIYQEPASTDTCWAISFTGTDPSWSGYDYNRINQSAVCPNGDMIFVGGFKNHTFKSKYGIEKSTPDDKEGGYIVRYTANGTLKWLHTLQGQYYNSSYPFAEFTAVKVGQDGSIYLAGYCDNGLTGFANTFKKQYYYQNTGDSLEISNLAWNVAYYEGYVMKLDSLGNHIWHFDLTNGNIKDLNIDHQNNIVCVGRNVEGGQTNSPVELVYKKGLDSISFAPYLQTQATESNGFVLKVKHDGSLTWCNKMNIWGVNFYGYPFRVKFDLADNIYLFGDVESGMVTYSTNGDSTTIGLISNFATHHATLLKYDSSGVYQWHSSATGIPNDMIVDSVGNSYALCSLYWPSNIQFYNSDSSIFQLPKIANSVLYKVNTQGFVMWGSGVFNENQSIMNALDFNQNAIQTIGFSFYNNPSTPIQVYSSSYTDSLSIPTGFNGLHTMNYDMNGHIQWLSTAPYTNIPPQIWPNQIKVNQDKIIFSAETLTGGAPTNFWINPFTDSIMLNGFDACIAQFGARGCGNAMFNPITSTNPNGISQYVFHDICAGATYTFPNGSQVSNLLTDTLQQSNFLSVSNVDSIIYTQLNVSPLYQQSIFDTICLGANYYFVDGTMQTNIVSNQIHVSPYFSQSGCDSVITTYLSVNMVDTSVSQIGNSLICNNPGASYQWIQCNPISIINGATNQTYTPTSNGTYAVIIAESNCKDTSACHTFVVTGNENVLLKNQISVYPNPTSDWIHIEAGQLSDAAPCTLYDAQGHVLMEQPLQQGTIALNLTSLASGFYYLKIGAYVVKVTKQ